MDEHGRNHLRVAKNLGKKWVNTLDGRNPAPVEGV